jgi:alpha-beta hydrolase superfamily lysophospholipase
MTDVTLRTADGLELAGLALRPDGAPRAAIAMVHGYGEHAGRYAALHRVLVGAGFAVAAADLRGFGRSPGLRGHIDAWRDYRTDVDAIVGLAASLAPGRPLFLFGHSMGGLIVLDYALERPGMLAGVIASGPALRQAGGRRLVKELAARLLSRVAPRLGSRLGLDNAGISSLPEEVEAYLSDPLVLDRATMRWGAEILRTMSATAARAPAFPRPLLLLHGLDDPINDPEGSRAFDRSCGHPDHQLRLYAGSRHEIHHDVGRAQFERDLLRWLRERVMRRDASAGVDGPPPGAVAAAAANAGADRIPGQGSRR